MESVNKPPKPQGPISKMEVEHGTITFHGGCLNPLDFQRFERGEWQRDVDFETLLENLATTIKAKTGQHAEISIYEVGTTKTKES